MVGAGPILYPEDGFDIAFAAFGDPLDCAGGIVDVSEGEGGDATAGGSFGEVFGREGAVFEGVI